MTEKYRKGNDAKKLGALNAVNLLKDSLKNYQEAQKRNSRAKDGNYKSLDLKYLADALRGVEQQVQSDNYYDEGGA
jgi:hypothetical protein|tara:strand:+ start:179 stop:406 length:228 start_codon:yes stop_codon:yes gene_type:complete